MAELLYAISLLLIVFGLASWFNWKDKGWAVGFAALFLLSGLFRFLMDWTPAMGSWLSWVITVACAFVLTLKGQWRFKKDQVFYALPWVLGCVFIMVRSYFPQFDIDSLEYHLGYVQWLEDRQFLPAIYQHEEVVKAWYFLTGFEEHLAIPGLMVDMPLCAGLVAGVIKVLGLCILMNLIPRQWPLLRYAAFFLLLVDDHFFFSSQSRFIYLNPSFIPVLVLLLWFSIRGMRGSSDHLWMALGFGLAAGTIKYHGVYFCALPALALVVRKFKLKKPSRAAQFVLVGCVGTALGVFGINALNTGNPLAPMPFSLFPHVDYYRGLEAFGSYFMQGNIWESASQPFRRLITPGILSMKMVAVLVVPVALLWGFKRSRWLTWAFLAFLVGWVWAIQSHKIFYAESRYQRYVLGIIILGLTHLALAGRSWVFKNKSLSNIFKRTFQWNMRKVQWVLGLALLLWLVVTIDTRFFNVSNHQRPKWHHIKAVVQAKWAGKKETLDVNAPYLKPLLMGELQSDYPGLYETMKGLQKKTGLRIDRGEGILVHSGITAWPTIFYANSSIVASVPEAGGYLLFEDGFDTLWRNNVRYLILPPDFKNGDKRGPFIRRGSTGELEHVRFDENPLFLGEHMKLVKIEHS